MGEIFDIGGKGPLDPEFLKKLNEGKVGSSSTEVEAAVADQQRSKECAGHIKYVLEKYSCVLDGILTISQTGGIRFMGYRVIPVKTIKLPSGSDNHG